MASRNGTIYTLEGSATWDLDVWGRVRRQIESNVAGAQVSAADLANAKLSAQATLATDYFDLRAEDLAGVFCYAKPSRRTGARCRLSRISIMREHRPAPIW